MPQVSDSQPRKLPVGAIVGIAVGVISIVVTAVTLILVFHRTAHVTETKAPLVVRMDDRGPYLILITDRAKKVGSTIVTAAMDTHPEAIHATFSPTVLNDVLLFLRQIEPRYVQVFMLPDELDVNFAWQWLTMSTMVDDDPFPDFRYGFFTGETPQATIWWYGHNSHDSTKIPGKLVDNLGPNAMAKPEDFQTTPGSFFLPIFSSRFGLESISHGTKGFTSEHLSSLVGAGIVHFGGHGHPDRVDNGITAAQVEQLGDEQEKFRDTHPDPFEDYRSDKMIAFSGACYTGVTNKWYETWTSNGKVAAHDIKPEETFCLNLFGSRAIAYFAALHADHGIPVYQEMEYLAETGASLGDIIKHTYDGIILANGGKLPTFEKLADGQPSPQWTPSEVMLKGTASRVLFGDPALIVMDSVAPQPPVTVSSTNDGTGLHISASITNTEYKSAFTDTYHDDLAFQKNMFNDRALIICDLPSGWNNVEVTAVKAVSADGQNLKHRLVGYAVEKDEDFRRLHAQIDFETQGYMQSRWRQAGSRVELIVKKK